MSTDAYSSPKTPWARFFLLLSVVALIFAAYRVYQHATAFTVGLDYFSPEFQQYSMVIIMNQRSTIEMTFRSAMLVGQ